LLSGFAFSLGRRGEISMSFAEKTMKARLRGEAATLCPKLQSNIV